jgi:hypothetical protein
MLHEGYEISALNGRRILICEESFVYFFVPFWALFFFIAFERNRTMARTLYCGFQHHGRWIGAPRMNSQARQTR